MEAGAIGSGDAPHGATYSSPMTDLQPPAPACQPPPPSGEPSLNVSFKPTTNVDRWPGYVAAALGVLTFAGGVSRIYNVYGNVTIGDVLNTDTSP